MHALALRYRLRDTSPDTLRLVGEGLAAELAGASGLCGLTWLASDRPDRVTSIATFADSDACQRFADGPSLERLRADPRVAAIGVTFHAVPAPTRENEQRASA
jgi:hypothetical protein